MLHRLYVQHASSTCDDHSAIRKSYKPNVAFFCYLFLFSFYQLLDTSSLYALNHSLYCITDMAVHVGFFIHSRYFGRRGREWHQYWRQITSILGANCSHHCSCNLQWYSCRWAFPLFELLSLPWKLIALFILNDIKVWRWVWWVLHLAWMTLYSWMCW